MVRQVNASAPGKVILHGEHSVVYGKKAIAVSVGLFTNCTITPNSNSMVSVKFLDTGMDSEISLELLSKLRQVLGTQFRYEHLSKLNPIPLEMEVVAHLEHFINSHIKFLPCAPELVPAQHAAFRAFLFMLLGIFDEIVPINVTVETELPVGAGLGSSASFAVALAGALLYAAGRIEKADAQVANQWAFVSESFVHGNPSGVDNSVASFGGAVVFQKGQPLEHIHCDGIRVLLVNTQVPRSTKALVAKVAHLKESDPTQFQSILDGISSVVDEALESIISTGDTTSNCVDRNQDFLVQFGVSHSTLDDIVNIAKRYNLSAKLTGAGGGGCAFILLPKETNEEVVINLKASLKESGYEFWDTKLGCRGFATS